MSEIGVEIGVNGQPGEFPEFSVLYRSTSNFSEESAEEHLPTIKVLGTGGTIASKGAVAHQTAGYKVDLTIEDLMKTIPDLSHTCHLSYEQILNIDSKEIGPKELQTIYQHVKKDIERFDGVVITHGTDTMEETAFFLQMTIDTNKPIVMCGSMRPSTAISSDGPMNLYQAIVIAANKKSRDRGLLVAFNDRIISGYYLKKANANSLDTFNIIGQGYLGNFVDNNIYYYFPPSKPQGISYIPIEDEFTLPEVNVLYAHQGFNNDIIGLMVENLRSKGLVLATMGAGSMTDATNRTLFEVSNKFNIPIIYSKRSSDGMVPVGSLPKFQDSACDNIIASGSLSPPKARILLQLCILNGLGVQDIKKHFKRNSGGGSY